MYALSKYSSLFLANPPFFEGKIHRYYSSKPQFTHYALLIGGGNIAARKMGSHTEFIAQDRNDWNDISNIKTTLIASKFFKEENIKVLFGLGEKTKLVDFSPLFRKHFLKIEPSFHCGAANLEDIEVHLNQLYDQMQPSDKLWIFLHGHGMYDEGLVLASKEESSTKNLSTAFVKEKLRIFGDRKIILFIDCCFSGQYSSLTASNIAVLTTSNAYRLSYTTGLESWHTKHLMLAFQGSLNIVEAHIQGALRQRNYYCSDSLMYVIDEHFRKIIKVPANHLEKFNAKFSDQIDLAKKLLFLVFVVTQPLSFALVLGIGKIIHQYKGIIHAHPTIDRLYNRLIGLKLRTIYRDQRIIQLVQQHLGSQEKYVGFKQLSLQEQNRLNYFAQQLRSSLKSYKETANYIPLAHYHYLEEKINLFFQSATAEDLKLFLSVCENLLAEDP